MIRHTSVWRFEWWLKKNEPGLRPSVEVRGEVWHLGSIAVTPRKVVD
jgi:hypothetical protein